MAKKIKYFDNGNIHELYNYKNGIRNGKCVEYYSNGEKRVHGYFKNGKPSGVWMIWEKDGSYDWLDMGLRY